MKAMFGGSKGHSVEGKGVRVIGGGGGDESHSLGQGEGVRVIVRGREGVRAIVWGRKVMSAILWGEGKGES